MEKVSVWALAVAYLMHFVVGLVVVVGVKEVFVVVAAAVASSSFLEASEIYHPVFYQHAQPINASKKLIIS